MTVILSVMAKGTENPKDRSATYRKDSLSLTGAVAMGTGVMIGAGIFALTGQIAELARGYFPWAFLVAAVVSGFSAYSYAKMARNWPSAGGIAMFLEKSYGKGALTGSFALLMYFSMVINESLVARTFGSYFMQLFGGTGPNWAVPALGVGLLIFAFFLNIAANRYIQRISYVMAFVKIAGLVLLSAGGLYAAGFSLESIAVTPEAGSGPAEFLGAVALGILAYKGFTTITNSGAELKDAKKNIGRAIVISLTICVTIYLLVAFAVGGNLSIPEISKARDYALADAARPAYGQMGMWITVIFALAATVSGVIASVFAVSRMLAMLTEMKLVPHSHMGMPGNIQQHTVAYTIGLAILLTVFFDLSRIASMGAIFYIVMDMAIHWGIIRHLREKMDFRKWIPVTALILDSIVLVAFLWVKGRTDTFVLWASLVGFILIFAGETLFIRKFQERWSAS